MFNYIIVRTDDNYNRALETEEGFHVDTHHAVDLPEPDVWTLDGSALFYLARTEEQAHAIMERLLKKTPGVHWGLFSLMKTGYCKPGDIEYTVVNDKGVLPA